MLNSTFLYWLNTIEYIHLISKICRANGAGVDFLCEPSSFSHKINASFARNAWPIGNMWIKYTHFFLYILFCFHEMSEV